MLPQQIKEVITQALLRRDTDTLKMFWQKSYKEITQLRRARQYYELLLIMNEYLKRPFYKRIRSEMLRIRLEGSTRKTDFTKAKLIDRLRSELLDYYQYKNEHEENIDDAIEAYVDQLKVFYSGKQGRMIVLDESLNVSSGSRLFIEMKEDIKQEIEMRFRRQLQAEFEFITSLLPDVEEHVQMLSGAISTAKVSYNMCMKEHDKLTSEKVAITKKLRDMISRYRISKTAAIDKWFKRMDQSAEQDPYYSLICDATLEDLAKNKIKSLPPETVHIPLEHMKSSIHKYLSKERLYSAIKAYVMRIDISYQTVIDSNQRTIFHLAAGINATYIFECCFGLHLSTGLVLPVEKQLEILCMRDSKGRSLFDIASIRCSHRVVSLLMALYVKLKDDSFDEVWDLLRSRPVYINRPVDKSGNTLLHFAIKNNKYKIAFELLENRAQNNINLSLRNQDGQTAFEVVAQQSSADRYNGLTICDMAIYRKDPVIFFESLQRDLSPDLFKICLNAQNAYGNARLHTAMRLRNCELAFKLVTMGSDLRLENKLGELAADLSLIKGLPLAHSAVYRDQFSVFEKISKAGLINIHQQSEDGCSLWDTIFMSEEEQEQKRFKVDLTPFRAFITALTMNTLIQASGSGYRVNISFEKYGVTVPKDAYVSMNEEMSGFEQALLKEIIELDGLVQPHVEKSRENVKAVYLRELTQWERFVLFFSTKNCEIARAKHRNKIRQMLEEIRNSFVCAAWEKQDQSLFDVVAHAVEHTKELADSYKVALGAICALAMVRPEYAYNMAKAQAEQERDRHKKRADESDQKAFDEKCKRMRGFLKQNGLICSKDISGHNLSLYQAVNYYLDSPIECLDGEQEGDVLLGRLSRQLQRPIALVTLAGEDGDELICKNADVMQHSCWGSEGTIFAYYDVEAENFSGIRLNGTKAIAEISKILEQNQPTASAMHAQTGPGLFLQVANSGVDAPSASVCQNTL